MRGARPSHDGLMICPGQEVGSKSSGVNLFELDLLGWFNLRFTSGGCFIDCFSVGAGCQRDIIRVFVPAFDL